ncbi:class I SAM-dependent methyltransferase [Actinokineospora sp. HUAS TT18]|uniref:class I SAM-dependent methyltransferase n=1 Tax=Actinokineospora sp. HUAS TT18 TaxID=3447451 RepID=UPI003F51BBB3
MTITERAAYYDRLEARTGMRETRQRSYALLDAPPGATIVDVGCGAGHAAAELAELGYRPIGVDVDPDAVTLARQRVPDHAGFAEVSLQVHTEVLTDHAALLPALGNMAKAALKAEACTQTEADEWLADLAARADRGRLTITWPLVFAVGTRT